MNLAFAHHSLLTLRLAIESHPEREDLPFVGVLLHDRVGPVEGNGDGAEHRDDEPQAQADAGTEVVDGHVALDRAEVRERDNVNHVVLDDRDLILKAAEQHEPAADLEPPLVGPDAAEVKAADRTEATGIEALEERHVLAGPADLSAGDDHVPAAAV